MVSELNCYGFARGYFYHAYLYRRLLELLFEKLEKFSKYLPIKILEYGKGYHIFAKENKHYLNLFLLVNLKHAEYKKYRNILKHIKIGHR